MKGPPWLKSVVIVFAAALLELWFDLCNGGINNLTRLSCVRACAKSLRSLPPFSAHGCAEDAL